MTLYEKFEDTALKFARKKVLFTEKEKWSYGHLKEKIETLSAGLYYSLGIRKRNRIALLLPNTAEYVISLFALFRLGAAAVPLNTFLKAPELEYIILNCQPDYIISCVEFLPVLNVLPQEIKKRIVLTGKRQPGFLCFQDLFKKQFVPFPKEEMDENETAVICYTSSTTGSPKGVMLTHANFITDVEGCLGIMKNITHKDKFLLFLPMFHTYTLTVCVFAPLLIGAGVYMLSSFKNVAAIVRAIFFRRVTILVGIPRVFRMFAKIDVPKFLLIFCPVRLAISGASAIEPEIIKTFKEKFNIPLIQGYGLTEAAPVVCLNPLRRQKPGSVGLPLPNCEVKVVDEEEREVSCNTAGELIVKGPMVMKGYFRLPEETEKAVRGGWLFTGDIAKIDEDGFVYIVDRKKDLIIFHGMNIYPMEVEKIIKTHPAVEEAAVIGKIDKKRGETPLAIVVLKEGSQAGEEEIILFLKGKIADYKIPHKIEFREELPKTPTGKILKRILREEINRDVLVKH
ncbi:MAG: long-chain-fatty-acid--CoA ligase [Candidatus Omnitrophota bacterium]